jgi:hypothetical protein
MKNHTIGVLTNRPGRGKLWAIRVGRHVSSAGFPIPTSLASATRVALDFAQALHFMSDPKVTECLGSPSIIRQSAQAFQSERVVQ